MKNIDYKILDIKLHTIVFAYTSPIDDEMCKQILLKSNKGDYILVEGSHCSCYDFDDTEWDATEYTEEELKVLANAEYNAHYIFWSMVREYF